jgi:hypothetical protein
MEATWLDWTAAALLGTLVSASELLSRYKDHPSAVLQTLPGMAYIAINSAAPVAALGLIHAYGWFPASRWTQVLTAGFGAMAFFRTSLFVVRAGDRDVFVGPSALLQVFLAVADRAADRLRALVRSEAVVALMRGVDYKRAYAVLPAYCLALAAHVAEADQVALARALRDLDQAESEPLKVLLLGTELANVVGIDVLSGAVRSLRDQIIAPAPPPDAVLPASQPPRLSL